MTDFNSQNNRAVWFDIPVVDLDRSAKFYSEVLGVEIHKEKFGDVSFCILDHKDGNGGCLVVRPEEVSDKSGILLYMNVDGRIKSALDAVRNNDGEILDDLHSIGPHGFRAIVLDSEGNRIALHSNSDS